MVGGAGTEGPCLGSAFYHELSEVVLNPPGASFCQGGQGQGQIGVARERVWAGRSSGQSYPWGWALACFRLWVSGWRIRTGWDLRSGRHWASSCQAE